MNVDAEKLRLATYQTVRANKWTKVNGQPTWKQWRRWQEEAEDEAITVYASYAWAGDYGMLAEVIGNGPFHAETGIQYVAPARPPAIPNTANMSGARQKEAYAINNEAQCNYAIRRGYHQAFGEKFRETFDDKFWEQLYEERYKYTRVTPYQYRTHMATQWMIMDDVERKRIKDEFYRGWGDEHLTSFGKRLLREQKALGKLTPPITISDEDANEHYMNQIWKRTDLFTKEIMMEWTKKPTIQKQLAHSLPYFESKLKEIEKYETNGGVPNNYATANAVSELKVDMKAELENEIRRQREEMQEEHANAIRDMRAEMNGDISKLTQAVMAMAEAMNKKPPATPATPALPPVLRNANRRVRIQEQDSESEPDTPPPRPRARPRKRAKAAEADGLEYKEGDDFVPGMKWNASWTTAKKAGYTRARKKFMLTGTPAALREKIRGIDAMIANNNGKRGAAKIAELKEERNKWQARLDGSDDE